MRNGATRLALPDAPRAAGIAREFVREFFREQWPGAPAPDTLDSATLCVSEMVTNALDHATPPYEIRLGFAHDALRVEVADASEELPVVQPVTATSVRGRGMFIVSRAATTWGVEATSDGKTVWAEFATPTGFDHRTR